MNNRLANCHNHFQGDYKRVLCVCSAGLLRSPTAALVLSQPPFNFNTRAVGIVTEYALIPVDEVLLSWADEIVCMEPTHWKSLNNALAQVGIKDTPVILLDIKDSFEYRDPRLTKLVAEKYTERTKEMEKEDDKEHKLKD